MRDNTVGSGGIKAWLYSSPILKNSTIVNNVGDGIQLVHDGCNINLINSIVANNSGYGINHKYGTGTPSISYSDFWDNGS